MKQWYCHIGGQRYGPVDEDVLWDWIDQGRVGPQTSIWSEGMSDWVSACAAMPEMFDNEDTPSIMSMVPVKPPAGTGGMTPNAQLMIEARQALSGRWGTAVGFTFLLGLITMAMQLVPYIGGLASMVCSGAFQLGAAIFFLTYARRGQGEVGMMFKGFENFGNSLGAYWLMAILTMLWMLLLIIPGIIAAYSYSQTMFLLAGDSTLGPLEAIRRSKEMMRGHKWRLFCLQCRFIGWSLLCILSLGIGFLWLQPYIMTSIARFHDDLMPPPVQRSATPATMPEVPTTFGQSPYA